MLTIKPLKSKGVKQKVRPLMEDCTIPKFPQSVLLVGASASGKTTLLMTLMTNKNMFKGFHDLVFLFSTTAKLDPSFQPLKLPDDHIFDTEEEMIKNLHIIFDAQKRSVTQATKEGKKAKKILCIFEDLTTNEKLLRDPVFKSLWTLGRHLNIQVVAMVHKYKALPRTQRLSAMNIIYFRGSLDETRQLVEDFTPPGHTRKEFMSIVEFATADTKTSKHNFLYMCNKLPFKIKFRKNFDLILRLKK